MAALAAPADEEALEERLSRPSPEVAQALREAPGDVVVLGAGGKMGPSLTAMLQRAADHGRRITAVSRWHDAAQARRLEALGVTCVAMDLLDGPLERLPDAPNVVVMAGQKFGTDDAPSRAWMMNTVLPARVAARYAGARTVVFSTGNVYPLVPVAGGGAREDAPPGPVGEYAMSCLGRERVFEDAAARWGTRVAIVRLNYAVDLRYGVLVDLARRLVDGAPIHLAMGYVNCIWQGDANAQAIRALPLAGTPPLVLNVTGARTLSVRATAEALAAHLGVPARFTGTEGADALLSDTTRARALFGPPAVDEATLLHWVADWLRRGGRTLAKPTRFERRDGRF